MPKYIKSLQKHASRPRQRVSAPTALKMYMLAGAATIVLSAFLAYLPCLNGGFVLDDDKLLTDNYIIKAADGIYRFWCTAEAIDYWPVSSTSLWLEWRLWGMNPIGYHVTNLILHIVDALLIWVVLRKLAVPGAFLAALIFTLHPVNVESVAWIASRKNLLAMLFFLLSILCYLKLELSLSITQERANQKNPSLAHSPWSPAPFLWYGLSLLAFVLAMLGKGSAAILPLILLGIVWWLRMGTVPIFASAKMGLSPSVSRWDLIRIAPFFLVAAVLVKVNIWFQTHDSGEIFRNAGFIERALGAAGAIWFYIYKALLPLDLYFVYPLWNIQTANLLWWLPLLGALAVTAILWLYRKIWSRPVLFAWAFFCVSLIPVLGFTDVGFMRLSLVADRYQHIAIIGLIALAAAGWDVWLKRAQGTSRTGAIFVALATAAILGFLTSKQCMIYRNGKTLYQYTLQKYPDCWLAYCNLGSTLYEDHRLLEAIEHYKKALQLKPDYVEAHNNLATALLKIGRLNESIEHSREALRLKPDYPEACNNLGLALSQIGQMQEAIEKYRLALQLKPNNAEPHNNLGIVLAQTGRLPEAIEEYRLALWLKPNFPEAHNNLGLALFNAGQLQEAADHCRQALSQKPDYPEAHNNLALALAKMGRLQEAIEHYRQALLLKPDNAEAHNNLGLALVNTGRLQEASEHYQQALRLNPNYAQVHNNLANIFLQAGKFPEAIEHYRQALRLKSDIPEVYFNLGVALMNSGRPQEAIDNFQLALKIKPGDALAHYHLGKLLLQTDRPQDAIAQLEQALQLKGDFPEGYANLAMAYARTNRSENAIAAAEKALNLARSQGLTALAKQLEDWLYSYRNNPSK